MIKHESREKGAELIQEHPGHTKNEMTKRYAQDTEKMRSRTDAVLADLYCMENVYYAYSGKSRGHVFHFSADKARTKPRDRKKSSRLKC